MIDNGNGTVTDESTRLKTPKAMTYPEWREKYVKAHYEANQKNVTGIFNIEKKERLMTTEILKKSN